MYHHFTGVCAGSSLINLLWATARQTYSSAIIPEDDEDEISKNNSSQVIRDITCSSKASLDANYGFPILSRGHTAVNMDVEASKHTGTDPKSRSLPSTFGQNFPTCYTSHNVISHNILSDSDYPPMKTIKGHKFGSVITLKERSLLAGGASVARLSMENTAHQLKKSSKQGILKTLLTVGTLLMLGSRLISLVVTALLIGPWLYMTICEYKL